MYKSDPAGSTGVLTPIETVGSLYVAATFGRGACTAIWNCWLELLAQSTSQFDGVRRSQATRLDCIHLSQTQRPLRFPRPGRYILPRLPKRRCDLLPNGFGSFCRSGGTERDTR